MTKNRGIRESDLTIKRACNSCSKPHTAHVIPFGEPTVFLVTGFCERCQRSLISLDGMGDNDVRPAASQLAEFFRSMSLSI